jgi:hypothetical protein
LTCPCSHASGLSFGLILLNRICHIRHIVKPVWCKYSNEPYDIVIKRYYRIPCSCNDERPTTLPPPGNRPGRLA